MGFWGSRKTVIWLLIGMAFAACVPRWAPPDIYPRDVPVLPPLEFEASSTGRATLFGPVAEFVPSQLSNVGHGGMFDTHPDRSLIAVLNSGQEAFAARVRTLRNADTSIHIQSYIFSGDETGRYISELLKEKKRQGLDVKVIVDAFANPSYRTQSMYFDLKQHGIAVEGYDAFFLEWLNELPIPFDSASFDPIRINKRFHEKMWVVDGSTDHGIAIVGGLNIENLYFGLDPLEPNLNWRDQDLIVKGSVVKDIDAAFNRTYAHFRRVKRLKGPLNTNIYWSVARGILSVFGTIPVPHGYSRVLKGYVKDLAEYSWSPAFASARVRFFQNRPRLSESYIEQAYLKSIEDARAEVLISSAYLIPSDAFRAAAKNAARRCVHLLILTNSPESSDFPELTMVGRERYRDLLGVNTEPGVETCRAERGRAGIEIWEWQGKWLGQGDRTMGTTHSKYAVFDRRWAIVGSHNLDPRSEKLNSESAIAFESQSLASDLAATFFERDLGFARSISLQAAQSFGDTGDVRYQLRKNFGNLFERHL